METATAELGGRAVLAVGSSCRGVDGAPASFTMSTMPPPRPRLSRVTATNQSSRPGAAAAVNSPAAPSAAPGALALAAILGTAAFIVYTVYSWLQWTSFAIRSWDLGIFTQLAKDYAHFQAPIVSIKGQGYNLLGDHFHPLLVLLGPVYRLFPSAFTLLVVQNLLFALSVAVIGHLAIKRLGRFPGACLGIGYALSWGLQSAIDAQFHEIAFAVPLIAFSLCALLEEKWRSAWIWASLLVFVKEDLGLTVLMIGLVMAWRARTPAGLWLAAWGVGWFVLATKVILPAMNPGDTWAYESQLDIGGLLADPASLFNPEKVITVLLLLAITAGLCIFSPLVLLVLPTLGWRFLSDLQFYWGQEWQYSAVLMPIVFVAAIDALSRRKVLDSAKLRLLSGAVIALIAVTLTSQFAFAKLDDPAKNFSHSTNASANSALAAIPNGVTVETDISLMSYLVDRTEVYWIGNKNPAPDYVLIDVSTRPGVPSTTAAVEAEARFPGTRFVTAYADGRYQVARRVTPAIVP
jgi:uncharacterized membrane protein